MTEGLSALSLHNQYQVVDGRELTDVIAEYVWIDGIGGLRSKCRTLTNTPDRMITLADLPEWNYDGSSCYQASTENSEVIMKPCAVFKDPFRGKAAGDRHHVLVLCETFLWEEGSNFTKLVPTNTNFRNFARPIFEAG